MFDHNFVVDTVFDYKVNYDETLENEYCLDYTTREDFTITEPLRVNLTEINNMTTIHSTVNINLKDNDQIVFECTCNDFRNSKSNLEKTTICKHLIVVLIDIGITHDLFSNVWGTETNPINYCLNAFKN